MMYALVVCLIPFPECTNLDIKADRLTRAQCIQQSLEIRALKPGTRTVYVEENRGELIDSAGRLKRGWQHGLSQ